MQGLTVFLMLVMLKQNKAQSKAATYDAASEPQNVLFDPEATLRAHMSASKDLQVVLVSGREFSIIAIAEETRSVHS